MLRIAYKIYYQIHCDLFFIDWEQAREIDDVAINKLESKKTPQSVSTWRKLFIANEYNELQTVRRTK